MAFQYATNDTRGNPLVVYVSGKWRVFYDHFTTTSKVIEAEKYCDIMNSLDYKVNKILGER